MSLVIRYRCYSCGAFHDGASSSAWVRCGYCRSLIGFDWQAWFASPGYGAFLKRSAELAPKFADYQKSAEAGTKAAKKGKRDDAEKHLREAVAKLMVLVPHNYPPEVQTDAAYRERYLSFETDSRLRMATDPALTALETELRDVCAKLDYRNPLPTLEKAVALLCKQLQLLSHYPGAADPDGMPPEARMRVVLALFVGAYLPMLSPAQRLEALRSVHGASNVVEAGGPGGADEIGHYVDWTCPRCELVSLQARHAPELMCPGCLHRRPFSPEVLGLGPVTVKCGSCAHAVPLGAGKLDARCEACGSTVRRVARTGSAEQALTRELLAASGAASPSEGTLGTPVTPENRAELVLLGLARQANWYGRVIQLPRYLEVVRRSLPELADAERARRLARVAELSAAETSDAAGRELVEQARAALSGR